jgi:hypothetical protein
VIFYSLLQFDSIWYKTNRPKLSKGMLAVLNNVNALVRGYPRFTHTCTSLNGNDIGDFMKPGWLVHIQPGRLILDDARVTIIPTYSAI